MVLLLVSLALYLVGVLTGRWWAKSGKPTVLSLDREMRQIQRSYQNMAEVVEIYVADQSPRTLQLLVLAYSQLQQDLRRHQLLRSIAQGPDTPYGCVWPGKGPNDAA